MLKDADDYRCDCKERLVFKETGAVVLKSRLIKVIGGDVRIKCKRCGVWVTLPVAVLLADPD